MVLVDFLAANLQRFPLESLDARSKLFDIGLFAFDYNQPWITVM